MTVQTIGPSENANEAMNTTSATSVTMPAVLGPVPPLRGVLVDDRKAMPTAIRLDRHADEAGEQQRPAAEAVDVGDGDERGQHVDHADGAGRGGGLLLRA